MTNSFTALGRNGWRIKIDGINPAMELGGARVTVHTDRIGESIISIPIRVVKEMVSKRDMHD